jgi:tRNA pseudouridine55 synthase
MDAFTGDLDQAPPAYSAVKVGGVRMYEAARRGEALRAEPRGVHVDEFALRRFDAPVFAFTVRCSSGTYVRSLVADVGSALGCGAHLCALRRTAIGPFHVRDAGSPDDPGPMLPLERAVGHLAEVRLHPEEARVAVHGVCLGPAGIAGPYRAVGPDGRLVGIYHDEGTKAVPDVILAPA